MRCPCWTRIVQGRRRAACWLWVGLSASTPAAAQSPVATDDRPVAVASNVVPGSVLTLQQALVSALAGNPELKVAAREVEAGRAAVLQGAARPNPELSTLIEDLRPATRTTTVAINQPIELGGKRAARIGAAQRGIDLAAAELETKVADVRATVTAGFHDVVLGQQHVALAADLVALAVQAGDAAAKRVQAGKVSPVEAIKARVAEAAARLDAARAGSELLLARQRLALSLGDAAPRFERAEPAAGDAAELPPPQSPQALALRLANAPGLQRARAEMQRRRALTGLERARRVPDVSVSLGIRRDAQLGSTQAVVGISVPLPVFDRNQGNLLEALRREDKSHEELLAAELQLRSAVLQHAGQLDVASAEARTIRDAILPGAQSAYDAATTGFGLGKFGFLDVLDAQRTLFQARSQYLRALGEAHRAAADIDRLLGEPMPAPPSSTKPLE